MYKRVFSKQFIKAILKLRGKEAENTAKKIVQIVNAEDINRFKNLRNSLKKYKRVHVSISFVILFYQVGDCVYFDNYLHHDEAYV